MKDLELLAKMLKENLEDLQKAESEIAKQIARKNLQILANTLANI